MPANPAQLLGEFTNKLDELKKKSLQIISDYYKNKEKVQHHLLACKLKHNPINLGIIASYPKADIFIKQISDIQKEIILLRNDYLAILRNII